jgi:hypothetical protein
MITRQKRGVNLRALEDEQPAPPALLAGADLVIDTVTMMKTPAMRKIGWTGEAHACKAVRLKVRGFKKRRSQCVRWVMFGCEDEGVVGELEAHIDGRPEHLHVSHRNHAFLEIKLMRTWSKQAAMALRALFASARC